MNLKKLLLVGSVLFAGISQAATMPMPISGNSRNGVALCKDGNVYAWGVNAAEDSAVTNVLCLDTTVAGYVNKSFYSTPQLVNTKGVKLKQVESGSGGFFLGVSDKGILYLWGKIYTEALYYVDFVPVEATSVKGYNLDGTPGGEYMGNVKKVVGSTSGYIALMNDSSVVISRDFVHVDTIIGSPKFIDVCAGDDSFFALSTDGMVYSTGIWNGHSSSSFGEYTNNLKPVLLEETMEPLKNVVAIGAGDVVSFAVTEDGKAYGWGNDSWGGCTGTGKMKEVLYANRIFAGEYFSISGRSYLDNVKQIDGGRGYGAAVTFDGYVLYWGNNNGNGGVAGADNSAKSFRSPILLTYEDGSVVKDAVAIECGDNFGYVVNSKNQYFAFGQNDSGQCGVGSDSAAIRYLHPMTFDCELATLCPSVRLFVNNLLAGDTMTVCEDSEIRLETVISSVLEDDGYTLDWYLNGKRLSDTLLAGKVKEEGMYEVVMTPKDSLCSITSDGVYVKQEKRVVENLGGETLLSDTSNQKDYNLIFKVNSAAETELVIFGDESHSNVIDTITVSVGENTIRIPSSSASIEGSWASVWANKPSKTTILPSDEFQDAKEEAFIDYGIMLQTANKTTLRSFKTQFKGYVNPTEIGVTPILYKYNPDVSSLVKMETVFIGEERNFIISDTITECVVDCEFEIPNDEIYVVGMQFTGIGSIFCTSVQRQDLNSLLFDESVEDVKGLGVKWVGCTESSYNKPNPGSKNCYYDLVFTDIEDSKCGDVELLSKIKVAEPEPVQPAPSSSFVDININSGNPSFPFPQFLEYKEGKTLAKYNAEGVTHADMEKTMREAYQIMSHRCRYEETHCGVPYITFNNSEKHTDLLMGGSVFCTEGDGYMLLASAIFADQPTFNGLWMWIHDNRIPKATRYSDGEILYPDYEYSPGLADWRANGENGRPSGSATDGDEDIALALLIAHKQWGDTMMQNGKPVIDFNGNPISYKQMAKDYLSAFVDTFMCVQNGTKIGHISGDIGVDGYVHSGNNGREKTMWRLTQKDYPDITTSRVFSSGGDFGFFDYLAPAYYHEFAKWLEEDGEGTDWQINQYKRGEASSDWLMGEAYKQGHIPSIGKFDFDKEDDTKVTFSNCHLGEDFRSAWRTILNYLWHGNPETTWNPKTHQIDSVGNTFQRDMAIRYAEFMKRPMVDSEGNDCGVLGSSPSLKSLNWFGPVQSKVCYNMDGTVMSSISANFALGCSAPSVVALGDEELLGDIYRECELRWEDTSEDPSKDMTDDDRYINSTPRYFHGWFRTLGMLVTSGNLAAPADMKAKANVKVYMSVDKTFAYKGDSVTYGVQLRNYGSADAKDAVVTTKLDSAYEFVSATKGGAYNAADHSIIWNISNIPGFKTGELEATMDSVSFVVKVKDSEHNKVGLTSTVSGSNFESWVSNAYPNNATYTMERNEVDILDNPLALVKNLDTTDVSVNDTVECIIKIANNEVEWLNGGRDNVRLSYGRKFMEYNDFQFFRFWHDASEAYVNLGNYRVSYYLNDTCALSLDNKSNGIVYRLDNATEALRYGYLEDGKKVDITMEDVSTGEDENGTWNKRIIVRFPDILSATTSHLESFMDVKNLIHKGTWSPVVYRTSMSKNPTPINGIAEDLVDDWSFSDSIEVEYIDGRDNNFTVITPGWYNEETLGEDITNYARHICDDDVEGFDRVVVEEWDGYTWRRIQGRGPVSGENYRNVVLSDQLPKELKYIGQSDESGLVIKETDGKLSVEIPELKFGDEIVLKYRCKVVQDNVSNMIEIGAASLSANNSRIESNSPALKVKTPTKVRNVEIDQNELVDVYNTSGILLKRQVKYKNALDGLETGVYMVNGVKTIHLK